ncbi:MAG: hypothetical protein AB1847_17425 [bacterium]
MAKKIGLSIAVLSLAACITILVTPKQGLSNFGQDIKTLIRGILSPSQIGTLISFRSDFKEKYQSLKGEHPDPVKIWQELQLSEEQQEQLLGVADSRVEVIHPAFMTLLETGRDVSRILLAADPANPEIAVISQRLGQQIQELAWNLALTHKEGEVLLTKDQRECLYTLHNEHNLNAVKRMDSLPAIGDDLAAFWEKLGISAKQVDALGVLHKFFAQKKVKQFGEAHAELHEKIQNLLTPRQQQLAETFYEKYFPAGWDHLQKKALERELLHEELQLSGEQKIRLIQIMLSNRQKIVSALQELRQAAFGLHEAVRAETLDRPNVMEAAQVVAAAIRQSLSTGASLIAEANQVLQPRQTEFLASHISSWWDDHLESAQTLPQKVHDLADLLEELELSSAQKEKIIALVAETRKELHQSYHWSKLDEYCPEHGNMNNGTWKHE